MTRERTAFSGTLCSDIIRAAKKGTPMKIDRLIGILSILLQEEKVTAAYLAEIFEVSRRTINRDVEALLRAEIPLSTSQGQNGGISIMPAYRIDRTFLTSFEMQSIPDRAKEFRQCGRDRKDFRMFKLNRIQELSDTGGHYAQRPKH